MDDKIVITKASEHNLKEVSLEIPRRSFTVITGLSGSGKSSLAFSTLYAEGQRRYIDTLSSYARYYMQSLEKPKVESIDGLSPGIAIEQKTTGNNPRSTVGTITEIYDFLRLLYAKAAKAYSPATGKEMVRYTDAQIVDLILRKYYGLKFYRLAPLVICRKGNYKELFAQMRKRGYTQIRVDGVILDLGGLDAVDRYKAHFIELVVDRLKPNKEDEKRVRNSVQTALNFGKGSLMVVDLETEEVAYFSKHLVCPDSGLSIPEPAPHTFSFNSQAGCCPHCKGLGKVIDIDLDTIIPDKSKSIAEGAIIPLGELKMNRKFDCIRAMARRYDFSIYDPVSELSDEAVSMLIYGCEDYFLVGEGADRGTAKYNGVIDDIQDYVTCPVCNGSRLNEQAGYFKIDGKRIWEVSHLEISSLCDWLGNLPNTLGEREKKISGDILAELTSRAGFLRDVGLDYLSLDRATSSLSGGESQRIRLATQIGSKLVNVLYILDEPSIGLHQRDNKKLISSLRKLRDEGNTVIVVEHDIETMLSADYLVDMGPGAGDLGGKVCFADYLKNVKKSSFKPLLESATLDYIRGVKFIPTPSVRRKGNGQYLNLTGCTGNNLKNVSISFPLGCLIGISGVSGSGKSSLISDTLVRILKRHFYHSKEQPLPYCEITGIENIDKIVEVDQNPIGKTPRSNPATFTGVFDEIRLLFENTPDAKTRGMKRGFFSFNVSGGRCEECKGAGIKIMEMNFLPSVGVECPVCRGKRYKDNVLEVRYKGKNISEVLEMTISEAAEFFAPIPKIASKLQTMVDVGLGYIRLGQSATTLSGGESQRMKLSDELSAKSTGRTLYILDEPTTGLHCDDINILLGVLGRLVDAGNTVIVIEHNIDVLKSVDYLFDLGPGGGKEGGFICAQGTPEEIAKSNCPTAEFL